MVLCGALGPDLSPGAPRHFAWQACHLVASTFVSRGRRGTWRHPPSFHKAGVAQTHIYRCFAWQAWHLWYWVAPLGRDLAPVTPRHFAWHAWHNLTSTFVSRGRRGTNSHLPSFCVAGVALMVLGGALGPGFGACDAAPLCVAGVALGDIHLRFTRQAWHKLTSTVVLRGRRGTDISRGRRGTNSHLPSFCVAGVALMVLGGALGPGFGACDAAPLCVAGVALGDIHLRFTRQAWHKLTSTVVLRGRRGTYGTGWRPWAGIWRL